MQPKAFSEGQIVKILKETENTQLKKMFAELSLENMAIKDVLEKKC